jgi:hypothetical protein
MPAAETEFLASHLFAGDEGRQMARRIDRRIDRLPGLAGLHLLARAAEHGGIRRSKTRSPESISSAVTRPDINSAVAA